MKTRAGNPLFLLLLLAGLGSLPPARLAAQTYNTLYSFTGSSDGSNPYDGLVLSSNTLYGTTHQGGDSSAGAVFALNTDGSGFRTLYSFSGGSDGANPHGALILSGNTLYGTASAGGDYNNGTLFALNTDGTGFRVLHTFTASGGSNTGTNDDGTTPVCTLTLSGNTLYGTAYQAGSYGFGTIFTVGTDGTGFNVLYSFTGGSDGAYPWVGPLALSGNSLYGTAELGGDNNNGTIFAVNTNGSEFTTLYSFSGGGDGASPNGLILSGNMLFGTTGGGGTPGYGTVFTLNTNGTGFSILHTFSGSSGGRLPVSPMLVLGNVMYGAAFYDGPFGSGYIFEVGKDGTGFTNLYSFTALNPSSIPYANRDGAQPNQGLINSANTLYGTARAGGTSGYGTIFSISLPVASPQLSISPAGANVILTWPTNATGFTLQSTPDLISAAWTTNLPSPVPIDGLNVVTNPVSFKQQFFRLAQ